MILPCYVDFVTFCICLGGAGVVGTLVNDVIHVYSLALTSRQLPSSIHLIGTLRAPSTSIIEHNHPNRSPLGTRAFEFDAVKSLGTICRVDLLHLCMLCSIMSCHVINQVMSCHVMPCQVTSSCHVINHVMSCHVMSCHVMPCHISLTCPFMSSYHSIHSHTTGYSIMG